eukprot:4646292-Amphidinium_carterae.1
MAYIPVADWMGKNGSIYFAYTCRHVGQHREHDDDDDDDEEDDVHSCLPSLSPDACHTQHNDVIIPSIVAALPVVDGIRGEEQ